MQTRNIGLDDWWMAIRSGSASRVRYLLSRRGDSVISSSERQGRLAREILTDVNAPYLIEREGRHTLPGPLPRIFKRQSSGAFAESQFRNQFGLRGTRTNNKAYGKHPGVAPYMWLPGGINARRPRTGETAAHICAKRGHHTTLELLIKEGIDLMATTTNGNSTPLHCAARHNKASCARLICQNLNDPKRDVCAVNRGGDTALAVAARFGAADVLDVLNKFVDAQLVNQSNESGETPLELATRGGHAEAVRCLIGIGAIASIGGSPDGLSFQRRSPLSWAVIGRNPQIVETLMDAGAPVSACHLYEACSTHSREPHIRDAMLPRLNRISSMAASTGQEDLPQILDIPAMQKAVEMAIRKDRCDVAFALLSNQAQKHREETARVVRTLLPSGDSLLALAARFGHTPVVTQLIDLGANVDERSVCQGSIHDGNTPLCESANESIVEILLANGADPNAKNNDCKATPLHFAARRGNCKIVELLMNAGASVNARTNEGFSPLVEAVRCAPFQDLTDAHLDIAASKKEFEKHCETANLLAPESDFTRRESDRLKGLCKEKDNTIASLKKEMEDVRAKAETDRLFCLKREKKLRTASRAILCIFQSIFTQKGVLKAPAVHAAISDYQEMCTNMGIYSGVDEEQRESIKDGEGQEENLIDRGMMPELTKQALEVDEWLPPKNPKKKPKKKSKAKLRKEREEKTMEALSLVAEQLNLMLNIDI